jgi:dolichol-phosphate mannosyltransferase
MDAGEMSTVAERASTPAGAATERVELRVACDVKCLVVIPTYNERANVRELIDAILRQPLDVEILVVDDHSPDGTAELVRAQAAADSRVHLLERPDKRGLGSAYCDGFRYALERTEADVVFQMDADFSHDPGSLTSLLAAAREDDLVLGSRYLCGVTVVNWPLKRLFLSYGANLYSRRITGMPFKDATGGFKCFRREVLEAIDWRRIHSDGYSFQIETTYRAWRQGFRVREVPIVFVDRRVGVSKMNRRIVLEAVFLVWRLALTHLFHARPKPRPPRPLLRRAGRG